MTQLTLDQLRELSPADVERILHQLSEEAGRIADRLRHCSKAARSEGWWRNVQKTLGEAFGSLSNHRRMI